MLKAYHGNKVLRIPDEKKKDYIALGYKITDMDGKVIHDPINNSDNVKDLKKTIEELNAKIAEFEAAVAEKDKAIEELNAKIAEAEKEEKKTTGSGKSSK